MDRPMGMPACFGNLEKVFPMGEDGLRTPPEACLACIHKTACLRQAISGSQGAAVRQERVDKAYHSGQMGFWERWSRKKALHRSDSKK